MRRGRGHPRSCCRRRRAGHGPFRGTAWQRLRSRFGGGGIRDSLTRDRRLALAILPEDSSIGRMTIPAAVTGSEGQLTVETRASWAVCLTALGIAAVSFAAPAITVVGLKEIAADLGGERSVPALAYSLARLRASPGAPPFGGGAAAFRPPFRGVRRAELSG